jgi:hypothetical protein
MPAPVVVTKDVGGYVSDYQAQTAIYRATGREVRLHECRSACTLALSLPNACVYPDSLLKFHLAYDPRNHQPNAEVSQQLFNSYPASVQARLGTLTREYKVLRGSELIKLGIRECNGPKSSEPKIMTASASAGQPSPAAGASEQKPLIAGLIGKMLSVFGSSGTAGAMPDRPGPRRPAQSRAAALIAPANVPVPPARPAELARPIGAPLPQEPEPVPNVPAREPAAPELSAGATPPSGAPLPPRSLAGPAASADRPASSSPPSRFGLPGVITGAQPILPAGFSVYADLDR